MTSPSTCAPHVYDGDIVVDGVEQANAGDVQVIRIGSGETPDAVVSATVSVGRLEITALALTDRAGLSGDGRFGD